MSNKKTDYTNTIFYKICCNDTSVKELYIGHTTNFVQRQTAHKHCCANAKFGTCKLYKVMRDNGGWNNWNMKIIAFHDCDGLMSAKKQEQHYFEEYKATLNSIEPFAVASIQHLCENCGNGYNHLSSLSKHKHTCKGNNKQNNIIVKTDIVENPDPKEMITSALITQNKELMNQNTQIDTEKKHVCKCCNFMCSYESNYNQHLTTAKHKRRSSPNENPTKSDKPYLCKNCGKGYSHKSTLCKHKHTCKGNETQNNIIVKPDVVENIDSKEMIISALIAQNK
jgi:hypothetical protein